MPSTTLPAEATDHAIRDDSWSALAAWAADELHLRLAFDGKQYRLEEVVRDDSDGDADPGASGRRSWFRRRPAKAETDGGPAPEPFTTEAPADVLLELVERLRTLPSPPNARPLEQPIAVHDIADRLFGAYQLNGGRAHLAGCHLEDVPLVRFTKIEGLGVDDPTPTVTHRFFDELGAPIDAQRAAALGIDRVAPVGDRAPRIDDGRLGRMLDSARRHADEESNATLWTIVWAKRATGRLRFEFGEESLDAPFEGWAATLDAPPIKCPQTGAETFHLAADDDGVIADAHAIAESAVTRRRRLIHEMERCTATGKLAEAEHFGACAASGDAVLRHELAACDRCGLLVSPKATRPGGCDACRTANRVTLDESQWNEIVAAHPGLAKLKWRVSETPTAYLLEASNWLRRRVVTLDRDTLEVAHAAEASRFSSTWRPISRETYDD